MSIQHTIGIDIGKISFKAVLVDSEKNIIKTFWKKHRQDIEKVWQTLKIEWQISEKDQIIVTGRFRRLLPYPSVVEKVAQEKAARFLYPNEEVTVVRLGGGGFSVLKVKDGTLSEFKQNPRCAAGVGSFLDQILNRVGLKILDIDTITENAKGLEITSRCGVTMKTDFTHLLNQGNKINEVIAGLLDSSARNVVSLAMKSQISSRVLLIGGLSVSNRIVQTIKQTLPDVKIEVPPHALFFEAFGAALIGEGEKPIQIKVDSPLNYLPSLRNYLNMVKKINYHSHGEDNENLILGLDIGSTGSKLVIIGKTPIFEVYGETKGQPVQAAQNLVRKIPLDYLDRIKAIGCTGSGREIVASLFRASLPAEYHDQIFVLNEIAAHAHGALYFDPEVDTVVDIGGQDAKFIRLEKGRVIDSCMNTVCSAGTGSFLAEQLQLLGIDDVKYFGEMALQSPRAVDLGQHCAVFVAEQIDEAKRKGAKIQEIVAGLYYSIILNYNNRVKGLRDYGQKIFLQGKPAENLALACALAKVTGQPIVVPPSPGSMGALGIALLTKNEIGKKLDSKTFINLKNFLESRVLERKEFRCLSKEGCVEGNLCPIQVITVQSGDKTSKFFWGGACDKYEKVGKTTIMSIAPRPFIEREKLISKLINNEQKDSNKTIGIARGLETEEILPLVITFFQELGFKVKLPAESSLKSIEEGAKLCQATFCAPLQFLAGNAKGLEKEDFLFLPKIIEIPGFNKEKRCYVCPLSQAAPDLFKPRLSTKVLHPFLNFKNGYQSNKEEFLKLGLQLGCSPIKTLNAFKKAVGAQEKFEHDLQEIGKEALSFAEKNQIPVVTVLGHPYIIYSSLLSAGIPEVIHEKGAIALPAECYPLTNNSPTLEDIYWGYGQRLLRVAFEVRRNPNVFPLWLSVYSCGPDSFLLHFFQYLSRGKPYTILETDAYTGQAGFKTRIEAFLYNIKDYQSSKKFDDAKLPDLREFEIKEQILSTIEKNRKVLIPRMGEGARILAALIKSAVGIDSEALPIADHEALEIGRKYTSGKECLPMIVTIGNLLKYIRDNQEKFYYFMPKAGGPCRFGQYQLLTKIILERLGLAERVKVVSPDSETGYKFSEQIGSSMTGKSWTAIVLVDLLRDALMETRPCEKIQGDSEEIFEKYLVETEKAILNSPNDWSGRKNLWGMKSIAKRAAEEFKKVPQINDNKRPKVLVTGEIYVRLDDFSNNYVIKELEALGAKVKLAPFREWINYTTYQRRKRLTIQKQKRWKVYLTWLLQRKIEHELYEIFAKTLNWSHDHSIEEILKVAKPYLSKLRPLGESALTIGLPLLLWEKREIAGTVVVGPFECMPTRIAETQLGLISERTGLPVLTLSFSGEPLDKELLESFMWDLKNL